MPLSSRTASHLAPVPSTVMPTLSIISQRILAWGTNGEPSYSTQDAPTVRRPTSQFHIIQPVCKRGLHVTMLSRRCYGQYLQNVQTFEVIVSFNLVSKDGKFILTWYINSWINSQAYTHLVINWASKLLPWAKMYYIESSEIWCLRKILWHWPATHGFPQ